MNRRQFGAGTAVATILGQDVTLRTEQANDAVKFSAGKGFDDGYMRRTPSVLVPIFGVPADEVADVLRILYRAQVMSMGFRPILFSDMNVFAHTRPYGWILEHHMSEYSHAVLQADAPWEASVLHHAQMIADYFRIEKIVTPDPTDGYRGFLRQLRELTGTEVGPPLPTERPEVTNVSGWRAWLRDSHNSGRTYNVETSSARFVTVEVAGGRGDNIAIVDGQETGQTIEAFLIEAADRSWPIAHVDTLEVLDKFELRLAFASLLGLGDSDGTAVVVCSPTLAARIQSEIEDERILLWPPGVDDNPHSALSMSEIELATTVRRASSALSRFL